jgi:hypothetical protein
MLLVVDLMCWKEKMFDIAAAIFGRRLRDFSHVLIDVDDLDIGQEAICIDDVSGKGDYSDRKES